MPRISISWRSYSFNLPAMLDEGSYLEMKEIVKDKRVNYMMPKLNFWKEFKTDFLIIGICISLFSLMFINSHNDILDFFAFVGALSGMFAIISFGLSLLSFLENHKEHRRYYKQLKEALEISYNYRSFCKIICTVDFRYYKVINNNTTQ